MEIVLASSSVNGVFEPPVACSWQANDYNIKLVFAASSTRTHPLEVPQKLVDPESILQVEQYVHLCS